MPEAIVLVKIILSPGHIVVSDAAIAIVDVINGLTVIVTMFDVAGLLAVHDSDDVITQVTWSRSANVPLFVYVFELVPTLLPFIFHW